MLMIQVSIPSKSLCRAASILSIGMSASLLTSRTLTIRLQPAIAALLSHLFHSSCDAGLWLFKSVEDTCVPAKQGFQLL